MRIKAALIALLFAAGVAGAATSSAQEVTVCVHASATVAVDGEPVLDERAGDCVTLPPEG